MKYLIGILFFFSLFFSCGKINEKIALDEIKKFEYSRQTDSQKLISFLNNRNPKIRLKTVEALGRIQDTSMVILLANRLKDEDKSVRKAAAFSLGLLFSPLAESYLIDAIKLDSDEEIRAEIIEALGKSGTENCFRILNDFLESDNHRYETAATVACGILAYRGFPPISNASPLEMLLNSSKGNDVRWRSAYSLFRIASPSSFGNTFKETSNDDPLVRYFVIKALSAMCQIMGAPEMQEYKDNPKISEALQLSKSSKFYDTIAKMANDSTWYVRLAAIQMMGLLGNRFFQDKILRATNDEYPYVQSTAIQTLANFNGLTTRSKLKQIYNSDIDWHMQGEALLTLAELDIKSTLGLIERNINKLSWPKNYFLIKALEKINNGGSREKSTELLMQLANEGELAQRTLALEALVDRDEIPVEFMLDKLKTVDPAITTIVATHLALRKIPQAVEPLIDVYNNFTAPKDIEAMNAIIAALDSIKSPRSVHFLETQLNNPYPSIQENAQKALIHITDDPDIKIPETKKAYLTKWDFKLLKYSTNPHVRLETSKGNIILELFPNKAPVTVANFIFLVQNGFYDSVYFHRVVPGFVIQGGDPRGDGWGGPGYSIPCEYNDIFYDRGVVGMADAGKDTGGSQFFITQLPQPHLNGRYTAFGKVIEGMDVVDQIMIFDHITKGELIDLKN